MLFVSKLIQIFLYPAGFCIVCSIAAIAALVLKRPGVAVTLMFVSAGVLWFFSTPFLAQPLVRALESRYDPPDTFPSTGAIVLLGGSSVPKNAPRRHVETNQFGDRIMHAARLLHKGYAPYIVSTGGKIPFISDFKGSEAQCMADLLTELFAVDSSRILLEPFSRTTADHPALVAGVLAKAGVDKRIILVTSAMHMPRSMALFRKAGYDVTAAPCDYWVEKRPEIKLFSFLPDASMLFASTAALHEYYGIIVYKILGKI